MNANATVRRIAKLPFRAARRLAKLAIRTGRRLAKLPVRAARRLLREYRAQRAALLLRRDALLQPRLGVLRQYPPTPLRLRAGSGRPPASPPVIAIATPSFNQG